MDIATLLGIIAGIFFIVWPLITGGHPESFWDVQSVFIVVGGGLASTFISYRINEITKVLKVVGKAFVGKKIDPGATIKMLLDLSQKARRDGILSLDSEIEKLDDDFIKNSLRLVVDAVEPEAIKDSMDLELFNLKIRHEKGQGLFKTMGNMFPAWGMIGTLVGLIALLKALDDPSTIGPAMSVALVTTFYGSVLANFICLPIAAKLAIKTKEEVQQKEMIIEGILSLQAGESPRIMEHKLLTFLSNEQKVAYEALKSKSGTPV